MVSIALTMAALVALLLGLLAVPVVLVIDAERTDTLEARWRVTWLFGLLSVTPKRTQRERTARGTPARRARSSHGGRRAGRGALAALSTDGLASRVMKLVGALAHHVRFERLRVDAAFGCENPADTGFVYGCLSPALVLADAYGLDVHCTPLFWESGVRGTLGATLRVRPLALLGTIVAFLVSPPVLRAIGAAWHTRG
jgi:hypothetical protein